MAKSNPMQPSQEGEENSRAGEADEDSNGDTHPTGNWVLGICDRHVLSWLMERAGDPKHKQKLVLRFLIVFCCFRFAFFLTAFSTPFLLHCVGVTRAGDRGLGEGWRKACVPVATLSQI